MKTTVNSYFYNENYSELSLTQVQVKLSGVPKIKIQEKMQISCCKN